MLLGTTGSGKTTSVATNALLSQTDKSFFVLDFKGSLALTTARYRRTVSDVKIIDPYGIIGQQSSGFDPIGDFDADAELLIDDALGLSDANIPIEGKEPHWPEGAQQMMTGGIIGVVGDAKKAGHAPRFLDLHRLLCEAEEHSTDDDGKRRLVRGTRYQLARMCAEGPPEAELFLGRFLRDNEETAGIRSHAIEQARVGCAAAMAKNLSTNDVDFGDLKRRPTTIYVVCPVNRVSQNRGWLRMIVT